MSMRLGCDVPYFVEPDDIRAFAVAAEEIGFDHIGFSEHIARSTFTSYPGVISFDDPWHEAFTMLAFLSAVTTRIELVSAMALVTLRSPVLVAKQGAEVALLSRGRVRLALSVGWNREEQVALGVDPATRGKRLDEMVPLLRRLWSEPVVTHHGNFFDLDGIGIEPRPSAPIPIWVGGGDFDTGGFPRDVAIRRAARLADGFKLMAPSASDIDRSIAVATELREAAEAEGRALAIEARLLTQLTPPDEWASVARRYRVSGVITHLGLANRIAGGTVDDQIALIRDVEHRVRLEL
ncbi:MAG TPA: TIGR03619 family F420-dependent LLM class oxidoreductase [Acidimicrobiales bacterium]|nr:TIGR03619 family F420-dependent LLM class oxidoreductase [Acidimicrobiales bacterium]